ncbi:MAG: ComEC family competence protein [Proteobacteria bacterium]|nr:ComEC family competence protein [Pseudomonadota bacterium]
MTLVAFLVVVVARGRPVGFIVALFGLALCGGFAAATLRGATVAHAVMERPAYGVSIKGYIEAREERERSDRIIVRVEALEAARIDHRPQRVRLSLRKGSAPPVGAFVEFKARLNPPFEQMRPGGYDFARDLYFQGIGGVGFVSGKVTTLPPPKPPGLAIDYARVIGGLRDAIDARIRAAVSGDSGAIASALITGKRDAISANVNEAMYVSSLGHILSISGYHMAVVAGVVFFVFRAGLALFPAVATRYPIKKWAALAALAAAAFYLLLSGAEVATRRAFIMTAVVLVGVLFDRAALTLRNLALAAFAVLLTTPEALVHPSFQMSFAATMALVAAYEGGMPLKGAGRDSSLGARIAMLGVREVAMLITASIVAGLATMPFAAFHFHRMAPYGVLANLLGMPIVSIWVMPSGLLALLALPFGFDAPLWRVMGEGIEWMTAVALWVASLPGAVGRIPAFGIGPLILCSAGLVVICLSRTPLRLGGAAMIVAAAMWAARTPSPDVFVAHSRDVIAVRGANGKLTVAKIASDSFALREWLAASADARDAKDKTLAQGATCDENGCIVKLADGRLVALARTAQAVAEDCTRAAVLVTRRSAPADCAALVIDRSRRHGHGALALRRSDNDWQVEAARPPSVNRPWAPATTPKPAAANVAAPVATKTAEQSEQDRPAPTHSQD